MQFIEIPSFWGICSNKSLVHMIIMNVAKSEINAFTASSFQFSAKSTISLNKVLLSSLLLLVYF